MCSPSYDPRYLAGIVLFNRHDFFEAHEVWESLWLSADVGEDRRFVQGLIQAAVCLHHFGNRNFRGALKLYKSGRAYMEKYASPHLGLDITRFWEGMELCLGKLLTEPEIPSESNCQRELIPTIDLQPTSETWPNPAEFLDEDD